jgi:hypothetical protein
MSTVLDIELDIDDDTGDELRSLHRWLLGVPEFRGRVTIRENRPEPGEMGVRRGSLALALEGTTGRVADLLGHTLARWAEARRRTVSAHRLTIQARIAPNEVVINIDTALRDGQLDPSVRALIDEIATRLRADGEPDPPANGASAAAVDNTGEPTSLTDDELRTLAAAFNSRAMAEALLRDAGMSPETFTSFDAAPSALTWWTEVGRMLALGKEHRGKPRLLRAAAARYPDNPVFTVFTGPRGTQPGWW